MSHVASTSSLYIQKPINECLALAAHVGIARLLNSVAYRLEEGCRYASPIAGAEPRQCPRESLWQREPWPSLLDLHPARLLQLRLKFTNHNCYLWTVSRQVLTKLTIMSNLLWWVGAFIYTVVLLQLATCRVPVIFRVWLEELNQYNVLIMWGNCNKITPGLNPPRLNAAKIKL